MVRENARFSSVETITQCVMGNHFHLLVRVAAQSAVSDAELLRRASGYYGKKSPYRKLLDQTFSEFWGKLPESLRTGIRVQMP